MPGAATSAEPFGSGHINDTYLVEVGDNDSRYVLQRINKNVFPDPVAIMENIARVTAHVQSKSVEDQDLEGQSRLYVISTHDGSDYCHDSNGDYWRLWPYIENANTIDAVQSEKQAFIAGSAFGAFPVLMHDLPAPRLLETIPNFHNTVERFAQFSASLSNDTFNRAQSCPLEIAVALANEADAGVLNRMHESGELPERVVHNDAKINNVMLDNATGNAVCVIDLDTVMPGLGLFDFGDLVRTATASAAEDEDGASMQLTWYAQLVEGYLKHAASFLTETEVELLPLAGRVITLETGLRFLTDYLSGDTYFKTDRADHNLARCRSQFSLLASIDQQLSQMQAITAAAYAKLNA